MLAFSKDMVTDVQSTNSIKATALGTPTSVFIVQRLATYSNKERGLTYERGGTGENVFKMVAPPPEYCSSIKLETKPIIVVVFLIILCIWFNFTNIVHLVPYKCTFVQYKLM